MRYLVRLAELELIGRERRMVERRIRQARFPAVKSLDSFDFKAIPSLNKRLVVELARCEYVERRENIIALGNSGTGKTHIALGLGLAACQKGLSVGCTTAAALVHELREARDEKRLLRFQKQLAKYSLLVIDELGFVPLSKTGAELLFEVFSQRYERGATLVTSNLPFDEWTEIFGSERLTGALLDRLTHHVHILEMNGESYRLNQSQKRRYALRAVKQRLHQASFREAVIAAYDGRCALSGLPEQRLLDAAHIISDKNERLGQPIVPNGLPLSKIHHAAFDAHLIGIDPDYRLHVSDRLPDQNDGLMLEALKQIDGEALHLPNRVKDRPDRDRLAIRFERFKEVA